MPGQNGTKERIVEAMYHLIARYGYDKASMSKICDAVGVTKPSVYYYFESKEAILLAVLESVYVTTDYSIDFANVTDPQKYRQQLFDLGEQLLEGFEDDWERRNVLAEIDLQSNRIPSLSSYKTTLDNNTINTFEQILKQGVTVGVFSESLDVALAARTLFLMTAGMSQAVVSKDDVDEGQSWRWIIDAMLTTYAKQ